MNELQLADPQLRSLVYAALVAVCFLLGYWLSWKDSAQKADISSARVWLTVVVGTGFVIGIYGTILTNKPASLIDAAVLAAVIAHGWTAEDLVQHLVERLRPGKR